MSRRRAGLAGLLAWILLAGAAGAQPAAAPAPPAVGDVPAGPARLEGRVVRTPGDAPLADVEVILYALPASGVPGVRRTRSGPDGRFVFEGISNEPTASYLVGARYRGIPFPGERVTFAPGESSHEVVVRIAEPRADARAAGVAGVELRLEWVGDRVVWTESHRLRNPTEHTIYVPAEARAATRPLLRVALPEGAERFRMPLGVVPEGVVVRGSELRFYGPLYPGEHELAFTVELPARPGRTYVRKAFPSGAPELRVVAPRRGLSVAAPGLEATEAVQVDGRPARALGGASVPPGGALTLALELPPFEVGREGVGEPEARLFLELDDPTLLVREEHRISVAGDAWRVAPADGSLLELSFPPDATDLRFGVDAFEFGLAAAPGGAVLRGPLPPGEHVLEVMYRVPAEGRRARLERRFGAHIDLLSVFVTDTGVLLESDRLHRRRPVRTADRTYLHLEAFEVEPGEPVVVSVSALPPPRSLPGAVRIALMAAMAFGVIWLLTEPLRGAEPGALPAEAADLEESPLRAEREAVVEALRDLEHDHETGKVSDEDYGALRAELRARALALLAAERSASQAGATPPGPSGPTSDADAAPVPCPACAAPARPGDRFCSSCGARLADGEAGEREASG